MIGPQGWNSGQKPPVAPRRRPAPSGNGNGTGTHNGTQVEENGGSKDGGLFKFKPAETVDYPEPLRLSDRDSMSFDCSSPRSLSSPKDFNLQGLSLPALAAVQVYVRKIKLQKGINADFGFSLRRVQFPTGPGEMRTVVYAEPNDVRKGPPRPADLINGLLPGDELLEIDGKRVDRMSREDIQNAILTASDTIELVVKTVPELTDMCLERREGGKIDGQDDSLLINELSSHGQEKMSDDEKYWLLHKGGYAMVRLLKHEDDGRVRIAVAGKQMVVDRADVDKANPAKTDRAGDCAQLPYLNDTSIMHLLRQRYGSNLLFTNAGSQSLLCMASLEGEASIRLMPLFKGCRRGQMPPHIYAIAQQVYRNIQMTGQNESLALTGVSGSGKTSCMRHIVQYLSNVAGWTSTLPYERLAQCFGIVEALANASTRFHSDSTRGVIRFSLGFDKAAALRSARIQINLLESSRIMRRKNGERSFNVFYYMWEGVDEETRRRLQLDSIEKPNIEPLHKIEERRIAAEAWERFLSALDHFDFDAQKRSALCDVLGAILHLHAAGASPGSAQRAQFLRIKHAEIAASLLGVQVNELTQAVFRGKSASTSSSGLMNLSASRLSLTRSVDGQDALVSFISSLYQELFFSIIEHLNKALASNLACSWITILDYPGSTAHIALLDPAKQETLGLNDLLYNYVNERVIELLYDVTFTEQKQLYEREEVNVDIELPAYAPQTLTRLLDEKQHLLTSTDIDRRSEERRGLLAILEEEALFPGASDDSLFERIFVHFGSSNEDKKMIRRSARHRQFQLSHGFGCLRPAYDVTDWVRQAQPCENEMAIRPLLGNSKSPALTSIFSTCALSAAEAAKMRRQTQAAKLELNSRMSSAGFLSNIRGQVDDVLSSLRRSSTRLHFVHCMQPTVCMRISSSDVLDVPFVRGQIRSLLIVDSVRANSRGYPDRISFRDFRRRFGCLIEDDSFHIKPASHASSHGGSQEGYLMDDRAAVQRILERMDVHYNRYRLGISQLLLANDVLQELDDRRELSLSGLIVAFQRHCRKYLAAKWLEKRRVLETAIRCIQKNGRIHMKIREWPWWKLYTRVVPLLAVARGDESERQWTSRISELEAEIRALKAEKTKAEAKASELAEEVTRQADASADIGAALQRETETRINLERRLKSQQQQLKTENDTMREQIVHPKEIELKKEIERLAKSDEESREKARKTIVQLRDVESEMAKLRSRNEILEKKQQRFDIEIKSINDEKEEIRKKKEDAERDRDVQATSAQRRNAELQELRSENSELRVSVSKLRRELDEKLENVAGGAELAVIQKHKLEMELKMKEQNEELDDLAGQVQQLKQTVTRLEMGNEKLKNELNREISSKESEFDELRGQHQRRIKALEEDLNQLQETNSALVKENRILDSRSRQHYVSSQSLEATGDHYKRELKRALALLNDTQLVLTHERQHAPSQAAMRQLREQLEDAETAKLSALKGRHTLESELNDLRMELDKTLLMKKAAEDRCACLLREKNASSALCEEKDEEILKLMKQLKAALQQNHMDHIAISDYIEQIADLEKAKEKLNERLNEQTSQNEFIQQHTVEKHRFILAEQKIKELEARLDLETAMRRRLEDNEAGNINKLENARDELDEANKAKEREIEAMRKLRKEMTQLQDSFAEIRKREQDGIQKQKNTRSEVELLEDQVKRLQADLKTANRRIEGLQSALNEGLDDSFVDGESTGDFSEDAIGDERAGTGMNIL